LSENTFPIVTYYGEEDTLKSVYGEVFIEKPSFGLTGLVAGLGGGVTLIASISALIIIGLIIFFIVRKKRR